jgi:hypothetical protein
MPYGDKSSSNKESDAIAKKVFTTLPFVREISVSKKYVSFDCRNSIAEKTKEILPRIFFLFSGEMHLVSFSIFTATIEYEKLTGHQRLLIREKGLPERKEKKSNFLEWVFLQIIKNKKIPYAGLMEEIFLSKLSFLLYTNLEEGLIIPIEDLAEIKEYYQDKTY